MVKYFPAVVIATAVLAAGCGAVNADPTPRPSGSVRAASSQVTATTVANIPLPGKGGHGDVVVTDPGAHAVYVAQSPDNNVVVIDSTTNTVKAVVPGIQAVNGIAYSDQYVFAAEASANAVAVISKSTWQVVATVPAGGKTPDAVYYTRDGSVVVANDDSNNMEVFSGTAPFGVLGSVDLQPSPAKNGPDLGTYAENRDRIYQADDNDVLVIDPRTRKIEKVFTLPLPDGAAAKDMYYEQAHQILWVATSSSEVLAINPDNGKVLSTVKTASGTDQVAADTDQGLLLLGEGKAGAMGVVNLQTHQNIANIATEPNFHTLAYLPGPGLVYAYLNESNVVRVEKLSVQ